MTEGHTQLARVDTGRTVDQWSAVDSGTDHMGPTALSQASQAPGSQSELLPLPKSYHGLQDSRGNVALATVKLTIDRDLRETENLSSSGSLTTPSA